MSMDDLIDDLRAERRSAWRSRIAKAVVLLGIVIVALLFLWLAMKVIP